MRNRNINDNSVFSKGSDIKHEHSENAVCLMGTAKITDSTVPLDKFPNLSTYFVQTCVAVALVDEANPKNAILVHFDTVHHTEITIRLLAREMKERMGAKPENIKATLVGGTTKLDYYAFFCCSNPSNKIYEAINRGLKAESITNIKHDHFSWTNIFGAHSYDVYLNRSSGEVKVCIDRREKDSMDEMAKNMSEEEYKTVVKRSKINPQEDTCPAGLEYYIYDLRKPRP